MADVDIIIVNYRSAAHTAACIGAARAVMASDGVTAAVYVENNGDDPAELERAVAEAGGAVVSHNPANLGFGAACNAGAARGGSEFILILNPDTRLKAGCLSACLALLRTTANVGIVGPELQNHSGEPLASCSPLPTPFDLLARTAGLHVLRKGQSNYPFLSPAAHNASGYVGQIMGAVMLVRRSLFRDLGGFDPRYFLYFEDVDLCSRAAAIGMRCYYLKQAHAIHFGRASSSKDAGMALALFLRSALTYARAHFGVGPQIALGLASYLIELPLRLLRTPFGGAGIMGGDVLRAYALLSRSLLTGVSIPNLARRAR